MIGAVVGGGAGAGVATWLDDDDPTPATNQTTSDDSSGDGGSVSPAVSLDGVAAVADKVQPSVVSIAATSQLGQGTGSGIVLSEDGEILTNNHVVEGTNSVSVTFSDGTTAEADVIETDPRMDLAVIKARDVSGLQPAALGSSDALQVGEQVVAIGSPLGLDGTVTTGIVSAMQRPVTASGETSQTTSFIDAVQTDAPINPGNSGGPLVNMAGEVIGINSAIITDGATSGSIGLGFAIPIDSAKAIVEELRNGQTPTHARLGVFVGETTGELGALIDEVEDGTAAEDAGLEAGDIVKKIDDRIVVDATELIASTLSYRPGDQVIVTYERNGEEQTVEVTLGSDAEST
jgi:putative serine protease PepD